MSQNEYEIALNALRFFCNDGEEQIECLKLLPQVNERFFFPNQSDSDLGCEYFYGVGCVFLTYSNFLYDKFLSSEEGKQLREFHDELNIRMLDGPEGWSAKAVIDSPQWVKLRMYAKNAVKELDETFFVIRDVFDINKLISKSEFRTSDEARRLLE